MGQASTRLGEERGEAIYRARGDAAAWKVNDGQPFGGRLDLCGVESELARQRPPPGARVVVLTLSGSLNPVHVGHVEMMDVAAEALRSRGHTVVCGYLVPSSEGYVGSKLGAEAISLRRRCELCAAALEDTAWLDVLDWGMANSYVIARTAATMLSEFFPSFKWAGYQVVGADFALKANLEACAREGNCFVCLKRHGLSGPEAERQEAWSRKRLSQHFIVANSQPREVSSTIIRQHAKAGTWDELAETGLLHEGVLLALREQQWLSRSEAASA